MKQGLSDAAAGWLFLFALLYLAPAILAFWFRELDWMLSAFRDLTTLWRGGM